MLLLQPQRVAASLGSSSSSSSSRAPAAAAGLLRSNRSRGRGRGQQACQASAMAAPPTADAALKAYSYADLSKEQTVELCMRPRVDFASILNTVCVCACVVCWGACAARNACVHAHAHQMCCCAGARTVHASAGHASSLTPTANGCLHTRCCRVLHHHHFHPGGPHRGAGQAARRCGRAGVHDQVRPRGAGLRVRAHRGGRVNRVHVQGTGSEVHAAAGACTAGAPRMRLPFAVCVAGRWQAGPGALRWSRAALLRWSWCADHH